MSVTQEPRAARRRIGRTLELLAALPVLVVALAFAARLGHAMATTSLWNDELYSIEHFSGRGVIASLTQYPGPNNHVLFNALTALLPLPDRTAPLAARAWSFLFVGGGLAAMAVGLARRRLWFELAVAAHMLAFSVPLVRKALEARGYGMLLGCGLGLSLAAGALLAAHRRGDARAGNRAWLAVGALSLAGTWAVPTFGLFAGPLVALLLAAVRTRAAWTAAGATLAAVVAVHAPLAREMMEVQGRYGARYGHEFGAPSAIVETLESGLLHETTVGVPAGSGPWAAAAFGALLVLATAGAWRRDRAAGLASALVLLAAAAFFAACLAMRTPLVRTAVFVCGPLLLAGLLAHGAWIAPARAPLVRAALAAALALAVVPRERGMISWYRFVPREDWRGVARLAAAALPEGMALCVPFRDWTMRLHLPDGPEVRPGCTADDLLAGRVAYQFDGNARGADSQLPHEVRAATLAAPFPEMRGTGRRVLHLAPPERSLLSRDAGPAQGLALDPATDGDLGTSAPFDDAGGSRSVLLVPEPGVPLRSLVVASEPDGGVRFVYGWVVHDDDSTSPLGPPLFEREGALVLSLGDRPARAIRLHLGAGPGAGGSPPRVRETWIYPTRR